MTTQEKFDALENFIVSASLNEEELRQWWQVRQNKLSADRVAMPFPVVYQKGNVFDVSDDLDLTRKNEVWGLNIEGLFIERTISKRDIYQYFKRIYFDHKLGILPLKKPFKKAYLLQNKFNEAINILRGCGIEADEWGGMCRYRSFQDNFYNLAMDSFKHVAYNDYKYCEDKLRLAFVFK